MGSLSTLFLVWLRCATSSAISSVQYRLYLCMWVNLDVTSCNGLLSSGFDGITDFAVVLVSVFSELQALQGLI